MLTDKSRSNPNKQPLSTWERLKLLFNNDINTAAISMDWPAVKKLITYHDELGIALDAVGEPYNYTVLDRVIRNKQNELIVLLIENGASTNTISHSKTPLQLAISVAAITAIKLLILNGAEHKNWSTLLDHVELATKNAINSVESAKTFKSDAENYLRSDNHNDRINAFIAYTNAGHSILALTENETENCVIEHIIGHTTPYYEEAVKLYNSFSPEIQHTYQSEFTKIKKTLEKIVIFVGTAPHYEPSQQTEPSTPDSDDEHASETTHLLTRKSSSDSKQSGSTPFWSAQKISPSSTPLITSSSVQIKKSQ